MLPPPTPDEVRAARLASGLTVAGAAELAGLGAAPRWAEYENGSRTCDAARWELFLLRVGLHPTLALIVRAAPV